MGLTVAVASGKGGTGKTTIAVNLAQVADEPITLIDCDVEEPNGRFFIRMEKPQHMADATVKIPSIDADKCTSCGKCTEFCEYNALAMTKKGVMLFPELCHGCGGCALVCPAQAITETERVIGVIEKGSAANIDFYQGTLNVGEVMSPPLIRTVKSVERNPLTILDSPPGTSCPMITAVTDSDYVVLVTEPTPFGMNDLVLAVEALREIGIPFGVVINRDGSGDDKVDKYCEAEQIEILARVPDDRRVAVAYSKGIAAVKLMPEYKRLFAALYDKIKTRAEGIVS